MPATQPSAPSRPADDIQKVTRTDLGYVLFAVVLLLFVVAGWFESERLRAQVWLDHENVTLVAAEAAQAQGLPAKHSFLGCGTGPLSMVTTKSRRNSGDMATIVHILAVRQGCEPKWLTARFVPTIGTEPAIAAPPPAGDAK